MLIFLSKDHKDLFEVGAWIAAIVGGCVALPKALYEMSRSNKQRAEDMRWKRAEMAKTCVDETFTNQKAAAALKMLDWEGLFYEKSNGTKTDAVDFAFRKNALRVDNTVFPQEGDEQFVRDCFDALFDSFGRLEHFISIRLILFEDVRDSLEYYVELLSEDQEREIMQRFITAYGFSLCNRFLGRFPEWRQVAPSYSSVAIPKSSF